MLFSEYKEARYIFNESVFHFYGSISKYDMKDFINWLDENEEVKESGWKHGEPIPFDLEELVKNYIENDPIYKPH